MGVIGLCCARPVAERSTSQSLADTSSTAQLVRTCFSMFFFHMISTFLLHASINMTTNKYRTLYSIVSRMISYNVSSNMYSPTSSSDSPNRLRITVSCLNEFLFQKSAGALTSKTTLKQQGVHCPPQKVVILPQKELLLSTKNIHVFQVLAFDGICTWEILFATPLDVTLIIDLEGGLVPPMQTTVHP